MGQAVATLADFKVNPSITVKACKLVFVDELVGDFQDFDANVFRLRHGSVKVEVFEVDRAKAGTFPREYTVEEELEKLQRCCVSTHIARVADAVATNSDLCAVRVGLVWTDFAYDHGMAYFLSLVQRDVAVVNAKERVGTGYTLGAGGITGADALAETAEVIGVQSFPCGFVPRITSELVVLQHIAGCRVKD